MPRQGAPIPAITRTGIWGRPEHCENVAGRFKYAIGPMGLTGIPGIPAPQDSALIISTATTMPTLTASVSLSTLTINSGTATLTLNGFGVTLSSFTNAGNLLLNGTEGVTSAPNNLAGSSVTYSGAGTGLVFSTWTYRNLVINGTGGTFNSPATGSQNVNETFTVLAGTFTQNTLPITVSTYTQTGGVFLGGAANMTLNGNFNLSSGATFYAPTQNMTFNDGNFTNNSVFKPQTGTAVFNANTTLIGQTSFYNFTAGPAAITLTFAAGSTQTITNNFTIAGQNSLNLMAIQFNHSGQPILCEQLGTRCDFARGCPGFLCHRQHPGDADAFDDDRQYQQLDHSAAGHPGQLLRDHRHVPSKPHRAKCQLESGFSSAKATISCIRPAWTATPGATPPKCSARRRRRERDRIYYDAASSTVYVAATQNIGRGSAGNSPNANNIWITSATLNASSVKPNFVNFVTPKAIDMLYPVGRGGTGLHHLANGEVGLGMGGDGNAWLVTESCLRIRETPTTATTSRDSLPPPWPGPPASRKPPLIPAVPSRRHFSAAVP